MEQIHKKPSHASLNPAYLQHPPKICKVPPKADPEVSHRMVQATKQVVNRSLKKETTIPTNGLGRVVDGSRPSERLYSGIEIKHHGAAAHQILDHAEVLTPASHDNLGTEYAYTPDKHTGSNLWVFEEL
ncbi:hypothetical protein BTUL_0128g00260 [Botrytis tulipae]|uniref:Uncharacterized protein n=1 Tax=Botrytis tulipae TaxID=87230 RepID=A0A4Z1EIQ0_9HELO|nr:hypothetical protein BTUL_0128g00260 [Botrytis tulipae]